MPSTACWPISPGTRAAARPGRSSGSRSSPGSNVTRRCSRSSPPDSRAAGRGAWPPGSARASRSRWARETSTPPAGRTSIRAPHSSAGSGACGAGTRCWRRPGTRCPRAPSSWSNRQRGVVRDPGPGSDRADEVVDLLARRPRLAGAEPEALVERADLLDDRSAEEDRVRDRAVPEVVVGENGRVAFPRGRGAAATVDAAPGHAVERRGSPANRLADVSEEALLVGAVVVGERDDVCGHVLESRRCGHVRARERSEDGGRRARWRRRPGRGGRRGSGRRGSAESR